MIINSVSVEMIRRNANRLVSVIRSKEDLMELATATSLSQVMSAVESILTNTNMYFDDELIMLLSEDSWTSFKAVVLLYTFNTLNKNHSQAHAAAHIPNMGHHDYINSVMVAAN